MSDDEEQLGQDICPPTEIEEAADISGNVVIPTKSKQRYEVMFESFKKWQNLNKTSNLFSEHVMLAYFRELSMKKSPSTLWSSYFMLKAMIKLKVKIDIGKYSNLIGFLKAKSKGYTPIKSKVFSNEEITNFINEAPDEVYLDTKVVLIFGLMGACKTEELVNITTDQIQMYDNMFLISIPKTKTAVARTFTISEQYFDIVNKYKDLRPQNEKSVRFFLNYQKGKCTCQPIGKNKFAKMPQKIAEYLKLENAKQYTGHSFRKTSTTLLANAGADLLTIKRHGAWKSTTVAEGYIVDNLKYKRKTESRIKSLLNQSSSFDFSLSLSNLPDFVTDSKSMMSELRDSQLNRSSFVDCSSNSSNLPDFVTDSKSIKTELQDSQLKGSSSADCSSNSSNLLDFVTDSKSIKTELQDSQLNRSSSVDCSSNSSDSSDFVIDSESMITELQDSQLNRSSSVDCSSNSSKLPVVVSYSESAITDLRDGSDERNKNRIDLLNKHFSFNNCANITINFN